MRNKTRAVLFGLCFTIPILLQAQVCQTPITATLDTVLCNDNNTPLDSLDDTFTYFLTVTGDSTSWSIVPDSATYPYGTSFNFGPFPINGGPLTVVVINNSDSLCTDTLVVNPPPPCSSPPPICLTPISASADSILCDDNGTPLDSLDDTFTFLLTVTGDSTTWSIAGDTLAFPYDTAITQGPFTISAGVVSLVVVSTSDMACADTVSVTPPAPCSVAPVCQTPISASVDSILCDDNGTPLDSLDDTFTFLLTVTGDSTTWSIAGDSLAFPFDTAIVQGPFAISAGVVSFVVVSNPDMVCTDSVNVTPPAPCSVAPMCQTPITADFANVLCDDNGSPLDSLDDTFTVDITATGGSTTWSLAGDTLMFPYDTAATVGPFLISAGPVTLILIDNADSLCMDTLMVTPPPPCSVPPTACDTKEIGCIKYELLGIAEDSAKQKTYTIMVTNNCTEKMIYTAFQVPDGLVARAPDNDAIYTSPAGREYLVRNPNFSPMYSIRFKTTSDSISGGQSDVFEYTLPPQADPDYILAVTRVAPKVFYQAHLNTFACKDTSSQIQNPPPNNDPNDPNDPNNPPPPNPNNPPPSDTSGVFTAYPNPTTGGPIMIVVNGWTGQLVLTLQLFNAQGLLLKSVTVQPSDQPQPFDLPPGLPAGLYWLKLITGNGPPIVQQLIIQW